MPHAAGPYRAQHPRFGVAFDGVEDIAGKALDKAPRRGGDRRRPQAKQRLARLRARHDLVDRGQGGAPEKAAAAGMPFAGGGGVLLRRRGCVRKALETGSGHRTISGGWGQPAPPRRMHGAADGAGNRGEYRGGATARRSGQMIVRGLRIACRAISVSLKDAGPRVTGSTERDALRRSSTPASTLGGVLGTCDCVGPPR